MAVWDDQIPGKPTGLGGKDPSHKEEMQSRQRKTATKSGPRGDRKAALQRYSCIAICGYVLSIMWLYNCIAPSSYHFGSWSGRRNKWVRDVNSHSSQQLIFVPGMCIARQWHLKFGVPVPKPIPTCTLCRVHTI